MQIKQAIERVPGGLMLIPLLLGACVHTFAPDAGKYLGSFSNGLMTGTVPILAVWFFCMGATINLKATGVVLKKSGTLVLTSVAACGDTTAVPGPGDGLAGAGHWWDVAVPEIGDTEKLRKAYAGYLENAARQSVVN